MALTIRAKVDSELTRRVGSWFTVREIQDKLKVKSSTLKPLIMKYARERLLKRRSVRGTARSVQFTPAAANQQGFKVLLNERMPYRNLGGNQVMITASKRSTSVKSTKRSAKKTASRSTKKSASRSSRRR